MQQFERGRARRKVRCTQKFATGPTTSCSDKRWPTVTMYEFYVNVRSDGEKSYSQLDIRVSWCDFGDYSLLGFGFLHNFSSCFQFQPALLVICCHSGVNASGSLGWNAIITTRCDDLRIVWDFQFGREMCVFA